MKNVKKILAVALALTMVFTLAACGSGAPAAPEASAAPAPTAAPVAPEVPAAPEEIDWEGKTYNLTFVAPVGSNSGAGQGLQKAIDAIAEKSEGHIVIESFWNTLIETPDMLQSVNDGTVDIAFINQVYYPCTMPMTDLLGQKFFCEMPSGAGVDQIFRTALETMPEFQQEFEAMGSHAIDLIGTAPNFFGCHGDFANQLIAPTDLNGKVVQASGNYAGALQTVGASPLNMSFSDWYTNFERGIVDVNYTNWAAAHDFGLCDVIDSYATFGTSGGIGCTPEILLVNLDVWNSLPDYVRDIIVEGMRYGSDQIRVADEKIMEQVIADETAAGKIIAHVDESQMQPWYDLAMVALDGWKTAAQTAGYDADACVEAYMAIVADYLANN